MTISDTTQTTEPSRHGVMRRLSAGMHRFWRDREGSTAIEFTALAIPFSLLVFAILESCISFAAQEVLTNATDEIARQLRTGQLRAASISQMICDRIKIITTTCGTDLLVDLRKYDTFAAAAAVKMKFVGSTSKTRDI